MGNVFARMLSWVREFVIPAIKKLIKELKKKKWLIWVLRISTLVARLVSFIRLLRIVLRLI